MATYVITEACIGLKDATCVEVCPAACIHTTPDAPQYYIDPVACIACEQCFFVCPVDAIFLDADVPAHLQQYIAINADYFTQNQTTAPPITAEQAAHVAAAVKAFATSRGLAVAVAVVDPHGEPLHTGRSGATTAEVDTLALDKAYTAANLALGTQMLARGHEAPSPTPPAGFDEARRVKLAGGYPIMDEDTVTGGVGVAGCPTPQQDQQCAQAGLAALLGVGH